MTATVPYPNATATPPASTPTTTTPPIGTNAPVAAETPLAFPIPDSMKGASPEVLSAYEADMLKRSGGATSTGSMDAAMQAAYDKVLAEIKAAQKATAAVDPTVAQGQNAYEHIWGVTPPKDYIEGLVKAGFNVFQIQLHELQMPGANRTQYYRDNLASMAAQIAQLMGRR